jgi:hypothetical protein
MKEQEELEAFRRFEAANRQAVWEQVLEARRQAEGSSSWRPNWMEGLHYQNQVHAALRARFGAAGLIPICIDENFYGCPNLARVFTGRA